MRRLPMTGSAATAPASLRAMRVAVWLAVGAVLAAGSIAVGVTPSAVIGVVLGAVTAVVTQRLQLARFAAGVRRSEGAHWIDRVPTSLAALRRPLRAIEHQLSLHSAALDDATARDRLRDVTVDALELEVDTLDRALGDAMADIAEILGTLDRALLGATPQAVLRRELVELRELVRLSVYAELPSDIVPLGDVVADVVSGGVPRGRVRISGALPSMTAPSPLIEAMVRSVIGHALSMGEHVIDIAGAVDGAMVVLEVTGPARPEPTIHIALARRAVAILGGDVVEKCDRMMVVVPTRFVPGLRAVTPQPLDWDLPEAM